MASLTPGYSFGSTEQVTNAKLATLVSGGSVSSIVDADISNSASITLSKINITAASINYDRLNLTSNIVNADINASAGIVDTKLATISTAGKVNASAITSLSSTPSGAGILPIANIATGTPTGSKFLRDDGTLQIPPTPTYLGSWTSATLGSSTQAATDGFLIGYCAGNGSGVATITIKSDSSNPPTTLRTENIVPTGTSITCSIFCPVKKSDYYLTSASGGGAGLTLFFISLGT